MSGILVRIIRAKSRERRRAESQAAQGFCLGALRAKVRGPKSYDFDIPQIGVKIPQKILLSRGECKFMTDQNHKKNLTLFRFCLQRRMQIHGRSESQKRSEFSIPPSQSTVHKDVSTPCHQQGHTLFLPHKIDRAPNRPACFTVLL